MGVRTRTIAIVVVTALVIWLSTGIAAVVYETARSNRIDSRETAEVLDGSVAALESEHGRLRQICGDWAPWDESYEFVNAPTAEFVGNNLPDSAIANLDIDFMVFLDASGEVVYGRAFDHTSSKSESLPAGLVRYLETGPALLQLSNPLAAMSGALSLPEGPHLVAAQPISRSDFRGAPNGTLVVGVAMDDTFLARIERITRQPISVYASASPTLPAEALAAAASVNNPRSPQVTVIGDRSINAYKAIPGILGERELVLKASVPRTAYLDSRSVLLGYGSTMTVIGALLVGVFALMLDRTVVRPLLELSSAVGAVERSADSKARVKASRKDEIGSLAVGINRMLDELSGSQDEMAYLVEHDPLTGLFNTRFFKYELHREIEERQRLGASGAIVWFDLDHFKSINDQYGHAAGDELLAVFGTYLRKETRSYCTVARMGGDEFGMLIPHADGHDAIRTATRLVEGFSLRTFPAGGQELRVSASAGIVLYPEHGAEVDELLARADIAMYDAKAAGGNQVVAYAPDDERKTQMTERLEATEVILSALREDRFVLYAQPMRGLADDGALRFELFLRMLDERGEIVLPADIIPTAERLGIIGELDCWVARRAVRLLAQAEAEGRDVRFAINLSGAAFGNAALLDVIRDEFEQTGAQPERLIIEVSESTTIANMEQAIEFIRGLRAIGCLFSLDGFGSKASSYYYLKHLPVDLLKIDGSLVADLTTDAADASFVHAIIEMCRGLNIQTVAEYVENEQSMNAISQTGVDYVQGHFVGSPEPLHVYLGEAFAEPRRAWNTASGTI